MQTSIYFIFTFFLWNETALSRSAEPISCEVLLHQDLPTVDQIREITQRTLQRHAAQSASILVTKLETLLEKQGGESRSLLLDVLAEDQRYGWDFRETIEALITALLAEKSERLGRLDLWIQTELRALLFYQITRFLDPLHFADELQQLRSQNLFLSDSYLLHGRDGTSLGLVTMAAEKEGRALKITDCYRLKSFSEADWFALTEYNRGALLETVEMYKSESPHSPIVPTTRCPRFLSGYTIDGEWQKDYLTKPRFGVAVWEVRHKSYEISPSVLFDQMRVMASLNEEGPDEGLFHVHLVFYYPDNQAEDLQMAIWLAHLNSYLVLSSFEEGLFPKYNSGMPSVENIFHPPDYPSPLDEESFVSRTPLQAVSTKLITAAFRTSYPFGTYIPGYNLAGIELRDLTRQFKKWREYILKIAPALADRQWIRLSGVRDLERAETQIFPAPQIGLFQKLGRLKHQQDFLYGDTVLTIPLHPYENGEYFSYRRGKFFRPSPQQRRRLVTARLEFIKEIQELDEALAHLGTTFSPQERSTRIKEALRKRVVRWARHSRVSELFEPY